MGTNYYMTSKVCDCCGFAQGRTHIGKSSGGWTFTFQGYRSEYDAPRITTYSEWLTQLEDARIIDEYGREVTLDEFKSLVDRKRDEGSNHVKWCEQNDSQHADRYCWLDLEGHAFTDREFS